jgi:hypothetical protein
MNAINADKIKAKSFKSISNSSGRDKILDSLAQTDIKNVG